MFFDIDSLHYPHEKLAEIHALYYYYEIRDDFFFFLDFREKVCVLFSLLLHNLSGAALRICQNILTGEFICCLDSFSAQINTGMFILFMIAHLLGIL